MQIIKDAKQITFVSEDPETPENEKVQVIRFEEIERVHFTYTENSTTEKLGKVLLGALNIAGGYLPTFGNSIDAEVNFTFLNGQK
jgi:hypothetical protein